MARGDITRDAVLEAMGEYDALGAAGFYERFGYRDALDYVIVYEGTEYPSKGIYGVAFDKLHEDLPPLRETSFSGGLQRVVPELRELGFEVRSRRQPTDRLRSGIEHVLEEYAEARATQTYGGAAPIWSTFKELNDAFGSSGPVAARATVRASWSAGVGTGRGFHGLLLLIRGRRIRPGMAFIRCCCFVRT